MVTIDEVRDAICGKIASHPLRRAPGSALALPFTDRVGDDLVVFLEDDGTLTDAGEYISELNAMGAYDEWENWPGQQDFLDRFNLRIDGDELRPAETDSAEALLAYFHGLSRITAQFKVRPEGNDEPTRFPNIVRSRLRNELVKVGAPEIEDRAEWARRLTLPRHVTIGDTPIDLDLSPVDARVIPKIFSYQDADGAVQRRHAKTQTHDMVAAQVWALQNNKPNHYAGVAILAAMDYFDRKAQKTIQAASSGWIELEARGGLDDALSLVTRHDAHTEYV